MSGLGAWSFGYYRQGMAVPNDRVRAGILAFKKALIANGHADGIDLASGHFGHSMTKQTKAFQRAAGITADGIIGMDTAMHLFRVYTFALEQGGMIEIPNHLLQKQGRQESGHDPVAQGFSDPGDEGWAQRHRSSWTADQLAVAWDPEDAAQRLATALKTFYVNTAADWDGAVASWNVGPQTAANWVAAGKPAAGGPIIDGQDFWTRATHYVLGVKAQPA